MEVFSGKKTTLTASNCAVQVHTVFVARTTFKISEATRSREIFMKPRLLISKRYKTLQICGQTFLCEKGQKSLKITWRTMIFYIKVSISTSQTKSWLCHQCFPSKKRPKLSPLGHVTSVFSPKNSKKLAKNTPPAAPEGRRRTAPCWPPSRASWRWGWGWRGGSTRTCSWRPRGTCSRERGGGCPRRSTRGGCRRPGPPSRCPCLLGGKKEIAIV